MHHQLVLVLRSTLRSEITLIPVAVQRTPQAIQILKLILICSKAEMVLPTFQLMAENGTSKDREKLMSMKRTAATTRQQATQPKTPLTIRHKVRLQFHPPIQPQQYRHHHSLQIFQQVFRPKKRWKIFLKSSENI